MRHAAVHHPVRAAGIAIALLLCLAGCVGNAAPPAPTPFTMRLVDIQSGTVRLGLHQVMRIDTGRSDERYSALIADERIVAVVQHRDETAGRFEPELIPLRVGTTQVALVGSIAGREVVGFTVVVPPEPVTK
jgi:hypothetical protein